MAYIGLECCPICPKHFKYKHSVVRHVKMKHTEGALGFSVFKKEKQKTNNKCRICEKFFSRKNDLKRHIKNVHATSLVNCPECTKQFTCNIYLKSHMNHVHSAEGLINQFIDEEKRKQYTYTCSMCDKRLKSKGILLRHIKEKHTGQRHKCTKCIRSFSSPYYLKHHIEIVHRCYDLEYEKTLLEGMQYQQALENTPAEEIPEKAREKIAKYKHYLNIKKMQKENVIQKK